MIQARSRYKCLIRNKKYTFEKSQTRKLENKLEV